MYFSYILIKYAIYWHVVENVFGKWNVIGYAVVIYVFTILSGIIFFVLLKFLVFHIRLSKCMRSPSVLIRFTTILFLFLTFKVILKLIFFFLNVPTLYAVRSNATSYDFIARSQQRLYRSPSLPDERDEER